MDALFTRPDILHLSTSDYVREHLNNNKVPYQTPLIDGYIDDTFLEKHHFTKKDQVCFNATGGMRQTTIDVVNTLQSKYPDLSFIPIRNMTKNEVIQVLGESKVYLEFGNLPGKEKLLREAVLQDCCVITRGDIGCGRFFNDITVVDNYKTHPFDFDTIYTKIQECFSDHGTKINDFQLYKNTLLVQKAQFDLDVERLFIGKDLKEM